MYISSFFFFFFDKIIHVGSDFTRSDNINCYSFDFSLDRTIYQDVVSFTYTLISVFIFIENICLGLHILFVSNNQCMEENMFAL